MLLPRLAATMLLTILVPGFTLAQPAPEVGRCQDTTTQLDRELEDLSDQLAREMDPQGDPRSAPATRALADLLEMDALRAHLRCLGLRSKGEHIPQGAPSSERERARRAPSPDGTR